MLDEAGRGTSLGVSEALELFGTDHDDRCPAVACYVLLFAAHRGFDDGTELSFGVLKAP